MPKITDSKDADEQIYNNNVQNTSKMTPEQLKKHIRMRHGIGDLTFRVQDCNDWWLRKHQFMHDHGEYTHFHGEISPKTAS